jgi:putative holliday junction resolvase
MRYLGIDYGMKKIGIALGDDASRIATPIGVIANEGEETVMDAFRVLIVEEGIEGFVVGVPERLGQKASPQKQKNIDFAERVKEVFNLPVKMVNEQFTSVESRRLQAESGSVVEEDAIAAMLILQEYLDHLS